MALIREPSASRASTIGEDSSTRRPTACTMRSMMRRYWCGELKTTLLRRELALALDPDLVELVAHDLSDRAVRQQRLERTVPERVLEHLLDESLALDGRDADVLVFEDFIDGGADLGPQLVRATGWPPSVRSRPAPWPGQPPWTATTPLPTTSRGPHSAVSGLPWRRLHRPRRVWAWPSSSSAVGSPPSAAASFSDRFIGLRPSRAQAPWGCDPSSANARIRVPRRFGRCCCSCRARA